MKCREKQHENETQIKKISKMIGQIGFGNNWILKINYANLNLVLITLLVNSTCVVAYTSIALNPS
jgi:hypothetical protein